MRKLNRESIHKSGDYMEVDIFPVRKPTGRRSAKAKPTRAVQQKLNERNAARKFTWLLQENFGPKDYLCELSYPSDFPYDKALDGREFACFLRNVKNAYKKANIDFRSMYIPELGEKNGRPHYHLVCSGELGAKILREKWNKRFTKDPKVSYIHTSHLIFTKTGLAGAAFYLSKDPRLCYRSYVCSKNLKQPPKSQRDGRISGRKLQELRNDIYNAELFEKLYPGYVFVDADPRLDMYDINEYGEAEKIDFPYITIRLYKKDSKYILRNREYA